MSNNRNFHRISQRMAEAAAQEMCVCTAAMVGQIVAKRQMVCHIPVGGNDPMGVPDL